MSEDYPTVSAGYEPPARPGPGLAAAPHSNSLSAGSSRMPTPASRAAGGLFPEETAMDLRWRWEAVQQGFIDDPRTAVADADRLVGVVLQRLSQTFRDQHQELERQWSDGEPYTEDLRAALQLYRTFFDRLLTL